MSFYTKFLLLLISLVCTLHVSAQEYVNGKPSNISYSNVIFEVSTTLQTPYTIGVQYGTESNFTESNSKTVKTTITSPNDVQTKYTFELSELNSNTIYYYRYFVYNFSDNQTYYTSEESLKTKEVILTKGDYVDMGLNVKWASCNVGANSPEECGGYYAYGETSEKEIYSYENYSYSGTTLDNICGNEFFDVATKQLGKEYRMPSFEEVYELESKCSHFLVTINGRKGFLFEAKNGNTIFLPYAGVKNGNEHNDDNNLGIYWIGVREQVKDGSWNHMAISYYDFRHFYISDSYGATVRPVYVGTDNIETKVCSTPEISFLNNKIEFSCDTENAKFEYSIECSDAKSSTTNNYIELYANYDIIAYAVAEGYTKSQAAAATLIWLWDKANDDANNIIVPSTPLLFSFNNGIATITGISENKTISVWTLNGIQIGTVKLTNEQATIDLSAYIGNIVLLKMGDRTAKIMVK